MTQATSRFLKRLQAGILLASLGWSQASAQGSASEQAFVINRGLWPAAIGHLVLGSWPPAAVEQDALRMRLPGQGGLTDHDVRLVFGGRPTVQVSDPVEGVFNFLLGRDPARWDRNVQGYRTCTMLDVRPGIDVRLRLEQGTLVYDLIVAPGARVQDLEVRCEGVDALSLDADGALLLHTPRGVIRQPSPRSWWHTDSGAGEPVDCPFRILSHDSFGFDGPPGSDRTLIVDPRLEWATYVGGANTVEEIGGLASQPISDDLIIVGASRAVGGFFGGANDYPVTGGTLMTTAVLRTAVVTRLAATGDAVGFSTFIGGSGEDVATALDVGPSGEITVGGFTTSPDFPTSPGAFQSAPLAGRDGWLVRIDALGTTLLYGIYMGGSVPVSGAPADDEVTTLRVDSLQRIVAGGWTASADFPMVPGGFSMSQSGNEDGWLAVIDPSMSGAAQLVHATFLGGSGFDRVTTLGIAPGGGLVAGGRTGVEPTCFENPFLPPCPVPGTFPTTGGALLTTPLGSLDGFITRFDPTLSFLVFSTLIGGDGADGVLALDVSATGDATAVGTTQGALLTPFPTTFGSFLDLPPGGQDGFAIRLDSLGTLEWSTYIGGSGDDAAHCVSAPDGASVVVAGRTRSANLATTPEGFARQWSGSTDAFVWELDESGSLLRYGSYLGGRHVEEICALVRQGDRCALAGTTTSPAFPVSPDAADRGHNGFSDLVICSLDLTSPLTGIVEFAGRGDEDCWITFPGGPPVLGNLTFSVCLDGGPLRGFMPCALVLQDRTLHGTFGPELLDHPWSGPASFIVDPSSELIILPITADDQGVACFPFPLPALLFLDGVRVAAQGLFYDGHGANSGISLSGGARVILGLAAP
jgi:hypothetical protein